MERITVDFATGEQLKFDVPYKFLSKHTHAIRTHCIDRETHVICVRVWPTSNESEDRNEWAIQQGIVVHVDDTAPSEAEVEEPKEESVIEEAAPEPVIADSAEELVSAEDALVEDAPVVEKKPVTKKPARKKSTTRKKVSAQPEPVQADPVESDDVEF